MILYHGSNVVVKSPRIIRSPRTLDFGEGFYTTTNKQQAKIFAQKVFARRKSGNATVTVYEMNFELALAASELCVLRFQSPDENWLDYVTQNRGSSYTGQLYDIVLGPVANDDVYATLSAFEAGILTKEQTITALKIKKLYDQFVLKSAEALLLLQYQESFTL